MDWMFTGVNLFDIIGLIINLFVLYTTQKVRIAVKKYRDLENFRNKSIEMIHSIEAKKIILSSEDKIDAKFKLDLTMLMEDINAYKGLFGHNDKKDIKKAIQILDNESLDKKAAVKYLTRLKNILEKGVD
ncbi:MAG: hypothetical protein H7Y41_00780 [Hyphomonadaceae bacterium]|nr:hypothetical protein [Clostridia bacterium]